MKRRSLIIGTLLITILCLGGCDGFSLKKQTEEAEEDKRVTVKVDTPKVSSISINGDFIGTVESEEQVYVISKLSGDVTETFFEVGDYVNEGDLLFTVDDTAAQLSYKQAQAALTTANASLNVAKAGVDTANAGVNTANANVNYQTASVTENFAKASTTDKQLQLAIDSQEVNFANNEVNIGVLEDTLGNLNDKLDSVNKALDSTQSMVDKAQSEFNKAAEELEKDPESIEANANYLIAEKALADARSGISSLESSKDTLKSSIKQTEASLKTAKNSNCLIVEQADIARNQKSDYDNYTKATIGNGGLASLASAQAGVVQAAAGVAQAEAGVTQSKAGISQAQAAVDLAQLQLDYANVTAPVSGIITSKGVTKNNMTSTGSVAYTIMSNDSKYVTFLVSEEVMKELSLDQIITVDRNGNTYDAVITENPGVADMQTGLFKVKAKINAADDIINGVKVKLIMTTQRADDVMTLPIDAVYHESEKSYVYTYSNGKANKVYVETGLFDDNQIEITSGINSDDQVITTWSSQLRNGVEVKVEGTVSMNDSGTAQSDDILIERN